MQFIRFRAMNTNILLAAQEPGLSALQDAQSFIERSEARFSRFQPASELSQLNSSAGNWTDVSDDLLDLLRQSMDFWRATGGLFDPSILPDLKWVGYDRSMDEVLLNGDQPAAVSHPGSRSALSEMELDPGRKRVRLPSDMELDLGGIAKGWIAEQTALHLGENSDACAVNAGGDMFFIGHPAGAHAWTVDVEDPRDPSTMIAALSVEGGAVTTSSIQKRTWTQGGQLRHHLIDPRSRAPARSGWLSVTVTAPSLTSADVFAKALLIGGMQAVPLLPPDVLFLAVDPAGELTGTLEPLGVIE